MDKGRFLIETHLRTGRSIKELAAAHEVSESWLFKLLRRYRLEGPAGLEPRSRRPKTSPDPHRRPLRGRDRARSERSSPTTASMPGPRRSTSTWPPRGARSPRSRRSTGCSSPVASSPPNPTSDRRARGPASWPTSPTSAGRPTSPTSKWPTASSTRSSTSSTTTRGCAWPPKMFVTTRSPDVVRTLHKAAATWGYPQRFLTDNGRIFTTPLGSGLGAMEAELLSLGIETKHSQALPSPDLRQGRALPPDAQEVPGQAGTGHDQEAAPGSARPLRRVLQHRATPPRHRAAHARSRR